MAPPSRVAWTAEHVREMLLILLAERDRQYAQRFNAQERAVAAALSAAEKAVIKAERAAEARFAAVNEFRAQLADQAGSFLTRPEYTAWSKALGEKIDELRGRMDTAGGRQLGLSSGWGILLGAVSMIATLVAVVLALRK